jgi:hypothetical protein
VAATTSDDALELRDIDLDRPFYAQADPCPALRRVGVWERELGAGLDLRLPALEELAGLAHHPGGPAYNKRAGRDVRAHRPAVR